MLRMIIIGASGWGREVLHEMTHNDPASGVDWKVAGFLDSRTHILDDYDVGLPILGDPFSYQPKPEDVFVCALGDPYKRHEYARPILDKGGTFLPLCPQAFLSSRVHLGKGCYLGHWVHSGPDVRVGDFTQIQAQTMLGHDVHLGDYVQVGAQVFMGGGVHVGDFTVVHPRATILPGVKVGAHAVVGAGAVVLKDVPDGTTVFGNPAKVIFKRQGAG